MSKKKVEESPWEKTRREEEKKREKEESQHRAIVVDLYQRGLGGSAVVNAYQTGRRLWS